MVLEEAAQPVVELRALARGGAQVRRWIARSIVTTLVCGTVWIVGRALWAWLRQKLGS